VTWAAGGCGGGVGVVGGEEAVGRAGDPGEEGAIGGDGGASAGHAQRWYTSTGLAKRAGGAGVDGLGPCQAQ